MKLTILAQLSNKARNDPVFFVGRDPRSRRVTQKASDCSVNNPYIGTLLLFCFTWNKTIIEPESGHCPGFSLYQLLPGCYPLTVALHYSLFTVYCLHLLSLLS